jgi:hypothetical protein
VVAPLSHVVEDHHIGRKISPLPRVMCVVSGFRDELNARKEHLMSDTTEKLPPDDPDFEGQKLDQQEAGRLDVSGPDFEGHKVDLDDKVSDRLDGDKPDFDGHKLDLDDKLTDKLSVE